MLNQTSTLDTYLRSLPRGGLNDAEIRDVCAAIRAAAACEAQKCSNTTAHNVCESTVAAGRRAEERLVRANLRLVVTFAKRAEYTGMPLDDLIQAGNLGLISAARRFDDRKGFRFSTYAYAWIASSIGDSLTRTRYLIRVPRQLQADLRRDRNGEQPLESSQLKRLDQVIRLRSLSENPRPEPVALDEPEVDGLNELLSRDLVRALGLLDRRSRELIVLRYGLGGERPRSLNELALTYGLTKERIRQLHNLALERLRDNPTIQAMQCWLE